MMIKIHYLVNGLATMLPLEIHECRYSSVGYLLYSFHAEFTCDDQNTLFGKWASYITASGEIVPTAIMML